MVYNYRMNIVAKKYRGKQLRVVYDAPCDRCKKRTRSKTERLVSKAFTEYVNYGWYDIYKVGIKLKKMR